MTGHYSQVPPIRTFHVHVYLKSGYNLDGYIKTRSITAWPLVKNGEWLIMEVEMPCKGMMQVNPDEIVYARYTEVKKE